MADIQHSLQIAAPPQTIYPLVATGKGFSQWWAADVTESDSAVELGFFNRATTYRLRLAVSQEPIYADWICETGKEWSGTLLCFEWRRLARALFCASRMEGGNPRPTISSLATRYGAN
jgi:hypothetical protein